MRHVTLVCLLVAGCGPSPEDLGRQLSSIYLGQPYGGHPSVGQMAYPGLDGHCTATLIGKKTVLTAAHCIVAGNPHAFVAEGVTYAATSYKVHPSYVNYLDYDIALLTLAEAPPIAPTAIATSAPSLGLKVTLIGYGTTAGTSQNMGNDWGTKRIATTTLAEITARNLMWYGKTGGTCYGDSGGPAFATINGKEVQVGITSWGNDPCGNEDYDTRVDAYVSWITQTAGGDVNTGSWDSQPPAVTITSPSQGQTVASSLTLSATISDDKGVTSATASLDGKPQGSPLVAAPWSFALAGLAPGAHTLRVSALDAAGNQGEASVTVTVAGTQQSPSPPPSPPSPPSSTGEFGAACQIGADCASGLCALDQQLGVNFCTQACATAGPCPGNATCFAVGSGHLCGPAKPAAADPGEVLYVGGCAAVPGASAGGWSALLPLVALALRSRRRGRGRQMVAAQTICSRTSTPARSVRPRALVSCVLLVAACGQAMEVGQGGYPIYLGTTYSGHPSVGELIYVGEQGICTATLIGKKTVLTAAHCIFPGSTHAFVAGGVTYQAASYKIHPSYNSTSLDSDLAIITLAQAPPIAPAAISTTAPWPGLKVTLIGYGSTSGTYENQSDDWGVKRITTATIWKVDPHELIWKGASGASCYGDSGGPAFSTIDGKELQVGITSHGPDPCGNEDHYTRVDAFVPWIMQTAGSDVNTGQGMDSQPPVVTINSPTQGQSVGSSLTVSASISDDTGVVSATLDLDGQPGATLSAAPFSFALTGLAAGSHSLRMSARDTAGNQGEATVTVSVVAAAPPTEPEPAPSTPGPTPSPSPSPAPASPSKNDPDEALYVGGCSSAPDATGATAAGWPATLALLLLALVRRRRSRGSHRRDISWGR